MSDYDKKFRCFKIMLEVKFYKTSDIDDSLLDFAVIVARYKGKWIWVKNKTRKSWEVPGGRREKKEAILETAKRELYEETGATEYEIKPVCIYSVLKDTYFDDAIHYPEKESYGLLYFAEITELGSLPDNEIEMIDFFDEAPINLSFPLIQPLLIERVKDNLTHRHH